MEDVNWNWNIAQLTSLGIGYAEVLQKGGTYGFKALWNHWKNIRSILNLFRYKKEPRNPMALQHFKIIERISEAF